MKRNKKQRQELLVQTIEENPFVTDEELAKKFSVSIQTIRLDRLERSIPELRERIKTVATKQHSTLRSLQPKEVIGEIIDITLDVSAISILDISDEHVFERNGIARGHHLFAQANSLAVAVIDEPVSLTVKANVTFVQSVSVGERVVAKALVTEHPQKLHRSIVTVTSYVGSEVVFVGEFEMTRLKKEEAGDIK